MSRAAINSPPLADEKVPRISRLMPSKSLHSESPSKNADLKNCEFGGEVVLMIAAVADSSCTADRTCVRVLAFNATMKVCRGKRKVRKSCY